MAGFEPKFSILTTGEIVPRHVGFISEIDFKLISFNLLLKKLAFSRSQIAACAISLIILISAPNFLIYKNERNAKVYSSATFDIFKTINKDINDFKGIIESDIDDLDLELEFKAFLRGTDLRVYCAYDEKSMDTQREEIYAGVDIVIQDSGIQADHPEFEDSVQVNPGGVGANLVSLFNNCSSKLPF